MVHITIHGQTSRPLATILEDALDDLAAHNIPPTHELVVALQGIIKQCGVEPQLREHQRHNPLEEIERAIFESAAPASGWGQPVPCLYGFGKFCLVHWRFCAVRNSPHARRAQGASRLEILGVPAHLTDQDRRFLTTAACARIRSWIRRAPR